MKFTKKDIERSHRKRDWSCRYFFCLHGNASFSINDRFKMHMDMGGLSEYHYALPEDDDYPNYIDWIDFYNNAEFSDTFEDPLIKKSMRKTWEELGLSSEKVQALQSLRRVQMLLDYDGFLNKNTFI